MKIGNRCRVWLVAAFSALSVSPLCAQRIAVKTNALYWAALSPNAGVEVTLSRHFTLNLEADFSPFGRGGNVGLRHVSFVPEVRYWFGGRPQTRHFIGASGMGTIYDLRFGNTRHDGDALGGGFTYGYSLVLNRRWSIEGTVGLGLLHRSEKHYAVGTPAPDSPNRTGFVFAPVKLGLSAVYIIR